MTHDTQELVERVTIITRHKYACRDQTILNSAAGAISLGDVDDLCSALTAQAEEIRALRSAEDGFGDTLGSAAVGHLRLMYPSAFETLGPSGRRSLRNFINARAALAGKGEA